MPREFTVVSRRAPHTDDLRAAASAAGVRATIARARDGAVDLIVDERGRVVLSVEYTHPVAVPDEIARVAPGAAALIDGPAFWTTAWASFGDGEEVSARIADELARRCDGVCVDENGLR